MNLLNSNEAININLFDNEDIDFFISSYENIKSYIKNNKVSDISYKIISSIDSGDIFITNKNNIYKVGDIIYYEENYNNLDDKPTSSIYPNKIYYNLLTSNIYFTSSSKTNIDNIVFNTLNVFSDFTKKININEINIGYYNDTSKENIKLFGFDFNNITNKFNLNSTNNLFSYNINNFNEFAFNYEILNTNNQKSLINIFSFKRDYSNIDTHNLNFNHNTALINGSIYKPYLTSDDGITKISIESLESGSPQQANMYQASINAKLYLVEKNNKYVGYYELPTKVIDKVNSQLYMNYSGPNLSNYDLMDVLTFLMMKVDYLEHNIKPVYWFKGLFS